MTKKILSSLLVLSVVFGMVATVVTTAHADTFNPNNLISDIVYDNTSTMNAAQIDAFLNTFPNSCISPNSGFQAIDPTGYNPSAGYLYGNYVSAGQVIYDAAMAYGINPQVLLATLQKEQSLVTGGVNFCSNGDQNKYTAAIGYGCPDSGTTYSYSGLSLYRRNGVVVSDSGTTCVNSAAKAGFSQQIIHGAWLLKFGEQRSEGNVNWAVINGNWNNSDDPQSCYGGPMTQGTLARCPSQAAAFYDGYTTIDGTATHMDDGATAALYWYTPHFHGNQSFFNTFVSWFGSPYVSATPYYWSLVSQNTYADSGRTQPFTNNLISVAPGAKAYIEVKARNFGYQTWAQNVVHLGTTRPMDRASVFSDTSWLSNNRIQMVESSVPPGGTGTFDFSITAPNSPGAYSEYFSLLAEGVTWMNDPGMFFRINVVSPVGSVNQPVNTTTLAAGQTVMSPLSHDALTLQKDGNLVLRDNFGVVWNSGTFNSGATQLISQADGNLVLYTAQMKPVWSTGTNGNGQAKLFLQVDGNLVLYNQSMSPLWSTGTSIRADETSSVDEKLPNGGMLYPGQKLETPDRKYAFWFQTDGNLVLYNTQSGHPIWASGTDNKGGAFLAMQPDGNLVLYNQSLAPLWNSRTAGTGLGSLTVQTDGNLVLYNQNMQPVWNTGTSGR